MPFSRGSSWPRAFQAASLPSEPPESMSQGLGKPGETRDYWRPKPFVEKTQQEFLHHGEGHWAKDPLFIQWWLWSFIEHILSAYTLLNLLNHPMMSMSNVCFTDEERLIQRLGNIADSWPWGQRRVIRGGTFNVIRGGTKTWTLKPKTLPSSTTLSYVTEVTGPFFSPKKCMEQPSLVCILPLFLLLRLSLLLLPSMTWLGQLSEGRGLVAPGFPASSTIPSTWWVTSWLPMPRDYWVKLGLWNFTWWPVEHPAPSTFQEVEVPLQGLQGLIPMDDLPWTPAGLALTWCQTSQPAARTGLWCPARAKSDLIYRCWKWRTWGDTTWASCKNGWKRQWVKTLDSWTSQGFCLGWALLEGTRSLPSLHQSSVPCPQWVLPVT